MAGARALEKGDWKQCEAYVLALPVWTHLGSEECVAKVKATLSRRIKEEALRTFLFAYSAYYEALSLDQVSVCACSAHARRPYLPCIARARRRPAPSMGVYA